MDDGKRVLVIGHGSAALRHMFNLATEAPLNYRIGCYRKRKYKELGLVQYFFDLDEAVDWNPTHVIIACDSEYHVDYIDLFRNSALLVEKPAVTCGFHVDHMVDKNIKVGYNYRYHPSLMPFDIDPRSVRSVEVEHIDYLPDWHKWENYRSTYVARDGIALTLSHGLDLIFHLFPDVKYVAGTKYCNLDMLGDSSCDMLFDLSNADIDDDKSSWINYRAVGDKDVDPKFTIDISMKNNVTCHIDLLDPEVPRNELFKAELYDFLGLEKARICIKVD